MDNLADKLKELRIEKGLTQDQVAKAIGVSQAAVNRWESEKRVPNYKYVFKLAQFFGCTTDFLMSSED